MHSGPLTRLRRALRPQDASLAPQLRGLFPVHGRSSLKGDQGVMSPQAHFLAGNPSTTQMARKPGWAPMMIPTPVKVNPGTAQVVSSFYQPHWRTIVFIRLRNSQTYCLLGVLLLFPYLHDGEYLHLHSLLAFLTPCLTSKLYVFQTGLVGGGGQERENAFPVPTGPCCYWFLSPLTNSCLRQKGHGHCFYLHTSQRSLTSSHLALGLLLKFPPRGHQKSCSEHSNRPSGSCDLVTPLSPWHTRGHPPATGLSVPRCPRAWGLWAQLLPSFLPFLL